MSLDTESKRLVKSAYKASFDPKEHIDWKVEPDKFGMSPEWSTKYGTEEWQYLTKPEQQQLTTHEVCSIMQVGIWFETILMELVLKDMYFKSVRSNEFQFALTEIADECRHSMMFSDVARTFNMPEYGPSKLISLLGWIFKNVATGPTAYGAILIAEEVLDVMQRDWLRDERVQTITRESSQIHVLEESRHMRFAKQQMKNDLLNMPRWKRELHSVGIAAGAYFIIKSLVHPDVYKNNSISPRISNHYKSMLYRGSTQLIGFMYENGLVNSIAEKIYRKAGIA